MEDIMKQLKSFITVITVMSAMLFFTVSPAPATDNPFIDLIGSTKIYYSHIATANGWETEVAVLNPTSSAASGTLTSYNSSGVPVGNPVTINLPAHGRYEVEVGATFTNSENIAYMVLTSEVFGLKGYSKFYKLGARASIMASSPRTDGLFTKIDHEGWTGIAFINTASVTANVTLTAYSNAGVAVAVAPLQVLAGEKKVAPIEDFFTQSVAGANYVGFTSDQGVVGFFLNGFGSTMLDGSQAL